MRFNGANFHARYKNIYNNINAAGREGSRERERAQALTRSLEHTRSPDGYISQRLRVRDTYGQDPFLSFFAACAHTIFTCRESGRCSMAQWNASISLTAVNQSSRLGVRNIAQLAGSWDRTRFNWLFPPFFFFFYSVEHNAEPRSFSAGEAIIQIEK